MASESKVRNIDFRRGVRPWTALSVLILLAVSTPGGSARSDGAGPRMTVEAGYGGYTIPGRWTPLWIEIEEAPASSLIELSLPSAAGEPGAVETLPCPATGSGRLECPVFAGEGGDAVEVRLVAEDRTLVAQTVDTSSKIFPGHLVLAAGVPAPVQQAISRSLSPLEPVLVVEVDLDDLPSTNLSYDGVSGLVLADPGPAISPAQTQALLSWIAGGGRMIVFGARTPPEGIISLLDDSGKRSAQIGLGRVEMVEQQNTPTGWIEDPPAWRGLLGLQPYARSSRLTAGKCFPAEEVRSAGSRDGSPALLAFLGSLTALFLTIAFTCRKKAVLWLVLAGALIAIPAVPVGNRLAMDWHRGAGARVRGIVIPGSGQVLIRADVLASSANGRRTSPWGVDLSLAGRAEGGIHDQSAAWRQLLAAPPVLALETGGGPSLSLYGCLTYENPPAGEGGAWAGDGEGLWEQGVWYERFAGSGGSQWRALIGDPAWLEGDADWFDWIQGMLPGRAWLAWRGPLPGFDLKIQGRGIQNACWVMPLIEGAGQ